MLTGSEADESIEAASRLSAHQLSELAQVTRRGFGPGIASYLGLNRKLSSAMAAAKTVGEGAGRGEMMEVKASELADAVLRCSIEVAIEGGRDASAVQSAWEAAMTDAAGLAG